MTEIKYYDDKLIDAIKAIEEFGDYNTTVEASERAGEILLHALQALPETAKAELAAETVESKPNYAWALGVDED